MKILWIDVYYTDRGSKTVGIVFSDWKQEEPDQILTLIDTDTIETYEPGNFYKRELPPIKKFLEHYNEIKPDILVVDGFIRLKEIGGEERPGLGAHVQEEFPDLTIVGVAKSEYCRTGEISAEVLRGESKNPLYVQPKEYGERVKEMYGSYRLPELLKILDRETKK